MNDCRGGERRCRIYNKGKFAAVFGRQHINARREIKSKTTVLRSVFLQTQPKTPCLQLERDRSCGGRRRKIGEPAASPGFSHSMMCPARHQLLVFPALLADGRGRLKVCQIVTVVASNNRGTITCVQVS